MNSPLKSRLRYRLKLPMVRFTLLLPEKLNDGVEEISREKGISKHAVIRLALADYIKKFKREGVKN